MMTPSQRHTTLSRIVHRLNAGGLLAAGKIATWKSSYPGASTLYCRVESKESTR